MKMGSSEGENSVKIVVKCDRCGHIFDENEGYVWTHDLYFDPKNPMKNWSEWRYFCEDCWSEMMEKVE